MAKSKLSVVRAAIDDVIGAALDRHPAPEPIIDMVKEVARTLRAHGWTMAEWKRVPRS